LRNEIQSLSALTGREQPPARAAPRASGLDSIFRTADVVGDAWSWLVMREALLYRVTRFDDFHRRLGVARSTLSARLAQLTAARVLVQEASAGYVPTAAGRDFLGCLLVTMRWGDRWHFPSGAPPLRLEHTPCGQQLKAVLQCAACRKVLMPRDVTAGRAPTATRRAPRSSRRRRTPDLELLERNRTCSIARSLTVAGDFWSALVIRECFFGTRRFDEFQRHLDIAPNILSARLKRLVEHDMLAKVQYETWPTRHEYRLTERGLDFYHVPLAMLAWGQRWLKPPGEDPRLTHSLCERPLEIELACASCRARVTKEEIALPVSRFDLVVSGARDVG
jgi:DNA-binding HxlR family transcriptional regulator